MTIKSYSWQAAVMCQAEERVHTREKKTLQKQRFFFHDNIPSNKEQRKGNTKHIIKEQKGRLMHPVILKISSEASATL